MNWQRGHRQGAAAVVLQHPAYSHSGMQRWFLGGGWRHSRLPRGWNSALDGARIILGLGHYGMILARLGCTALFRHLLAMSQPAPTGQSPRWVKVVTMKSRGQAERSPDERTSHRRRKVGEYVLVGMLWLYLLLAIGVIGWIVLASPLLHLVPPLLRWSP